MIATIPYIEEKFREYNRTIFRGELPEIPIKLSNAKGFLGKLCYTYRRNFFGRKVCSDFVLRINTRIDLPEQELEDTIIHEMIHLAIAYHKLEDTSAHGCVFREMMNTINTRFNRHITVSHRNTTPEQRRQAEDTRIRPHVICVVEMTNGRTCVKAVPRIADRIRMMDARIRHFFPAQSLTWYLTSDPYFNRYPVSTALKLQYADPTVLQPHLATATPLDLHDFNILS